MVWDPLDWHKGSGVLIPLYYPGLGGWEPPCTTGGPGTGYLCIIRPYEKESTLQVIMNGLGPPGLSQRARELGTPVISAPMKKKAHSML